MDSIGHLVKGFTILEGAGISRTGVLPNKLLFFSSCPQSLPALSFVRSY